AVGEFLQASGRSTIRFSRRGVGQQGAGAGAHRHGRGRTCRGEKRRRRGRLRGGTGRGDQRRLGDAGTGHQCRPLFGSAPAARNRREAHAPVRRGSFVTPQDFDYLRKLLRERSGLVLAAEKQYLAESRLVPVARRPGLGWLGELINRLRDKSPAALIAGVVEAMTTNETFFFRDKLPFDHFRDTMMPALIAARERDKRIRIWCTAASTGQEPYS